jgi:four helix bundle protein
LKNEIFNLIKKFPNEERFKLSDQLLRSARSVCANIAEGHGRFTYKDQLHFCIQARGSLSESHNHLIDALDCSYIEQVELDYYKDKIAEVTRLLNGYIAYLRNNQNH